MKNKALLSKLACTVVCLSPLVITGCDSMGEFFGDSSYRGQEPYQQASNAQHHAASKAYSASSTTSRTVTNTTTSTSAVPAESPIVHNPASTAKPVKVPATVTPNNGPTMIPPTVAQ